jgi:chromosome segregation ATPase
MQQYLGELITLLVGGFATWLWQRLKTRRERKESDLKLINEAINPLVESVRILTSHNSELAQKVVTGSEQNLRYLNEIISLKGKVQDLEYTIKKLTVEIEEFKKAKHNRRTTKKL